MALLRYSIFVLLSYLASIVVSASGGQGQDNNEPPPLLDISYVDPAQGFKGVPINLPDQPVTCTTSDRSPLMLDVESLISEVDDHETQVVDQCRMCQSREHCTVFHSYGTAEIKVCGTQMNCISCGQVAIILRRILKQCKGKDKVEGYFK